jgi:cell division protein ZipA
MDVENKIRFILLLIGVIIILAILYDGIRRQRKHSKQKDSVREMTEFEEAIILEERRLLAQADSLPEFDVEQDVQDETPIAESRTQSGTADTDEETRETECEATQTWPEENTADTQTQDDEENIDDQTTDSEIDNEAEIEESNEDVIENDEAPLEESIPAVSKALNSEALTQAKIELSQVAKDLKSAEVTAHAPTETPVQVETTQPEPVKPTTAKSRKNQLVLFSLKAPEEGSFGGFKLLQVFMNLGLQYGSGQLFHYHQDEDQNQPVLFSVAAASETGQFDISNMANFSVKGLLVYMNSADSDEPSEVLKTMIALTQDLASELNASLHINMKDEWSMDQLAALEADIIA